MNILKEGSYFNLSNALIASVVRKLTADLNAANNEPISFSLESKGVKELIITPFIKEDVIAEYRVSIDGKQDKRFFAKTLRGLAKNLLSFASIAEDEKVHTTITLSLTPSSDSRVTKGIKGNEDLKKTIDELSLGDEVKLVRVANNARHYANGAAVVAQDEFAVEVRTLDNKSIGFIPDNHRDEARIARKIVQRVRLKAKIALLPYTQKNLHTNKTYVNTDIKINVDEED